MYCFATIRLGFPALQYHIVAGAYTTSAFYNSETIATLDSGIPVSISVVGSLISINTARILKANVNASNGFLHIIDTRGFWGIAVLRVLVGVVLSRAHVEPTPHTLPSVQHLFRTTSSGCPRKTSSRSCLRVPACPLSRLPWCPLASCLHCRLVPAEQAVLASVHCIIALAAPSLAVQRASVQPLHAFRALERCLRQPAPVLHELPA